MMGLRALVRDFLLKRQLRSIERPLFRLDKNIIAPQKILLLLPSLPEELKWVGTALREL